MKREHKLATGVGIGVSILFVGGILTWATVKGDTVGTHSVQIGRIEVRQEAMKEDIGEIKVEQGKQAGKLDDILDEVRKRNGGE